MRDYDTLVVLARQNPHQLLQLVRKSDLNRFERSMAIEALGLVEDRELVLTTLFELLDSDEPTERLGAVHALSYHKNVPTIRSWLEKIGATDTDIDVREAVEDLL